MTLFERFERLRDKWYEGNANEEERAHYLKFVCLMLLKPTDFFDMRSRPITPKIIWSGQKVADTSLRLASEILEESWKKLKDDTDDHLCDDDDESFQADEVSKLLNSSAVSRMMRDLPNRKN